MWNDKLERTWKEVVIAKWRYSLHPRTVKSDRLIMRAEASKTM